MFQKIFAFLFLLPLSVFAQPVDFSSKSLDFNTVNYLEVDSLTLTLSNSSGYDISVTGIDMFSLYDVNPFYVKDSVFTITSGNAHDVWVYFEPEQNILHQLVAIVKTDFRGDYVINLSGKGNYTNTYYTDTYNKREEDLKASLKTITGQGYVQKSYSGARDEMYGNIDNVNGDVTCVYTGRAATFNDRPGANNNSFNCEHTFPQGFFSQNLPMRSDIHHLFPTDVTSNSQRGNLEFGVVTGTPTWSQGGSKKGNGVFEPRDAQKGQVARALFYFVLRYQDYSNHVQGQEAILRDWFAQYQPNSFDIQRNNDIYAVQNNRNPFVDYPQFLKRITTISGNSMPISNSSLYVSRDTVDMRGKVDSTLYTISLFNSGNEAVTITDYRISDVTNFDFDNAMSDMILLPGEGFEIPVRVTPSSNTAVNEVLSFDTDVPGMATVNIELLGEWTTLSTGSLNGVSSINVYPNPSNEMVVVSWDKHMQYGVRLFDLLGKQVLTQQMKSNNQSIDISDLPTGVYVIETYTVTEIEQTILVIE